MFSLQTIGESCVFLISENDQSIERLRKIAESLEVDFKATVNIAELLRVAYDRPACVVCSVDTDKNLIGALFDSPEFDPLAIPVIVVSDSLTAHEVVRYMEQSVFKILHDELSEQAIMHWIKRALLFEWDRMNLVSSFQRTNVALEKLSLRQLQVLREILKGKPTKYIATNLNLSQRMIEKERSFILSVFGVTTTSEVTLKMGEYRVLKKMRYRIDEAHFRNSKHNHLPNVATSNPLEQFVERFGEL